MPRDASYNPDQSPASGEVDLEYHEEDEDDHPGPSRKGKNGRVNVGGEVRDGLTDRCRLYGCESHLRVAADACRAEGRRGRGCTSDPGIWYRRTQKEGCKQPWTV
jgi:hypothetical protein